MVRCFNLAGIHRVVGRCGVGHRRVERRCVSRKLRTEMGEKQPEGAIEWIRASTEPKGVGRTYLWRGECTNRIEPDVQGRSKPMSQ